MRRLAKPLLVALALASRTATAEPTPSDRATAQSVRDAGREALAAGRLAEACPRLAESQRLVPDPDTLGDLALCHEREGRLATAWTELREAERLAAARGLDPRTLAARVAALEPRVPRLVIVVTSRGAAPIVLRDGQVVAPAIWGVAVAIDPGEHVIETHAGSAHTSVIARATPGEVVRVEVPGPAGREGGEGTMQRALGWVFGGVGVAAIGAGVGLRLAANGRHRDAVAMCNAAQYGYCPDAARSAQSDAEGIATLSGASFALGGVGLIAGSVLVLTSGPSAGKGTALRLGPTVSSSGAGVVFGGSL